MHGCPPHCRPPAFLAPKLDLVALSFGPLQCDLQCGSPTDLVGVDLSLVFLQTQRAPEATPSCSPLVLQWQRVLLVGLVASCGVLQED